MVRNGQDLLAVAHLKMTSPPDKRLGANDHSGKGADQGNPSRVGPAIK